ncbi:hypothetical protein RHJ63_12315 [Thermosynechococcus sp. JY1334]|uniref:hypothetical protein n=1 Tax=unclassified Thermosynechococcus TaxID=2622553 RepID=UPI00267254FF|nr:MULTISPECIES: hypothetical protein [unclassified Thermosynechococcus]MDR7899091.1 hypothetical protein [Thermosynechococcus sp. JY1332]MDR7906498.1 hypothetical protein [Thermosynechococcus sp. JY1334]MDR7994316.1 hypothetical protein [Thermosynechococcus sp. TG252]WKT86214.1 hypothetical protein QYC30_12330 [Thermosynechococcus sp. JY1339]WNC55159.1 hypothetical protein RHJ31_12315 [Thermosynechococcus sp. JY1331]
MNGWTSLLAVAVPLVVQAATPAPEIITRAIAIAAEQFGEEPAQISVVQVQPKVWSDGCLGLGGLRVDCAERLTPGWEITLTNPKAPYPQQWVYRSNHSGSLILWDAAGSRMIGTLIQRPQRLSPEELPPPLPEGVSFRVIRQSDASGNRSPSTTTTLLYNDGRIVQQTTNARGETLSRTLRTVTPAQVSQFNQWLSDRRFERFNGFDFVPTPLERPVPIHLVSTPTATVRFAEANEYRLASDLVAVLRAWELLVAKGRLPDQISSQTS